MKKNVHFGCVPAGELPVVKSVSIPRCFSAGFSTRTGDSKLKQSSQLYPDNKKNR